MTQAKRNVLQAIEAVAGVLGNTRSVCRKSYVHPAVIDAYMDGSITDALRSVTGTAKSLASHLRADERAVLALLQRRFRKAA